jgi:hypothetical protein
VEFEFSKFTSLLRSVSAAAKLLLVLYFSHGFNILQSLHILKRHYFATD